MKTIYSLLSGNSPLTIVIIFLIAILLWMPSFFIGYDSGLTYIREPMPLFGFLEGLFEGYPKASVLFAFLIFALTAFLLDYINTRFILLQDRTFLPAWTFLFITSFYPGIYHLDPMLPATLFIVLMLHFIFAAYKAEPNCYRFFDAGLAVGMATLFYAHAIWFFPVIWISTLILRPFYWREYVHPVLGTAAVFFVAWAYYYVFFGDATRFFTLLSVNLQPELTSIHQNTNVLAGSVYIIVMIAISSFFMLRVFQFRKIYARNYFYVFFWLFLFGMALFFYPTGGEYGLVYVLSFPVSYIIANYYVNAKPTKGKYILFLIGLLLMAGAFANRLFMWF